MTASALIFGVVIEPVPQHTFDPSAFDHLVSFNLVRTAHRSYLILNDVHRSSIDEANLRPRIVGSLRGYFLSSSRPRLVDLVFTYDTSYHSVKTILVTPSRHVILGAYEDDIDAAIEKSSHIDIPLPNSFDLAAYLIFVRKMVEKASLHPVNEDDDSFRNIILHALRQSSENSAQHVPINFIYLNPTTGLWDGP
jgi:hypothetical protein